MSQEFDLKPVSDEKMLNRGNLAEASSSIIDDKMQELYAALGAI